VKFFFLVFCLFASLASFAKTDQAQSKKEHRHHESHVHGNGKLAIGMDDKKGKVEFRASAESLLGFEHQAKSKKDKTAVKNLKNFFGTEFPNMVTFDPALNCLLLSEKIDLVRDGKHSDFVADFKVTCEKPVTGTTLTLDFARFTQLKNVEVTILVGSLQKTVVLKQKPVKVELKP